MWYNSKALFKDDRNFQAFLTPSPLSAQNTNMTSLLLIECPYTLQFVNPVRYKLLELEIQTHVILDTK